MGWFEDKKEEVNSAEVKDGDKDKSTATAATETRSVAEQIAESLRPLTDSFSQMSQRLDEIQQNTVKRPEPRQPEEPTSVLDNENVAFAQRLTPIMLRQLEVEARLVRADIQREYNRAGFGDMWDQFEKQINAVLEGTPVVNGEGKTLRGDPQYIRNVVDMVLGRAAREAGMRFDGKSKGFFLETTGGEASHRTAPVDDGLTNDQRKVMQRMKISLDDAKKVMGKLKFVS